MVLLDLLLLSRVEWAEIVVIAAVVIFMLYIMNALNLFKRGE